jgi:hypothetical protein
MSAWLEKPDNLITLSVNCRGHRHGIDRGILRSAETFRPGLNNMLCDKVSRLFAAEEKMKDLAYLQF